jgi:hypothetical protein
MIVVHSQQAAFVSFRYALQGSNLLPSEPVATPLREPVRLSPILPLTQLGLFTGGGST